MQIFLAFQKDASKQESVQLCRVCTILHRDVKPGRVKFKVKTAFVLIWYGWVALWLGLGVLCLPSRVTMRKWGGVQGEKVKSK